MLHWSPQPWLQGSRTATHRLAALQLVRLLRLLRQVASLPLCPPPHVGTAAAPGDGACFRGMLAAAAVYTSCLCCCCCCAVVHQWHQRSKHSRVAFPPGMCRQAAAPMSLPTTAPGAAAGLSKHDSLGQQRPCCNQHRGGCSRERCRSAVDGWDVSMQPGVLLQLSHQGAQRCFRRLTAPAALLRLQQLDQFRLAGCMYFQVRNQLRAGTGNTRGAKSGRARCC